ncbi:DMT family transporter [Mycobacterium sp. PSTR-4-N]|uniref:DMT family transporter n=1 Tax=Mycobacterium sp. PSTR-4-N TaxID=2917745 RepID=UPI001F1527FF|nr:DMT family transporter [Mycobacterium sp. PSTR-4-N]MCG7598136.1 DMT family transporter [Mycobacterium sp. PSTR-4-N]
MSSRLSVPVWLQFGLLATAWGSSFLFIKVGLEGLSPAQVVLARLVGGALALLVLTLMTRARLPGWDRVWLHVTVVAVLLCVAPFLIFAWAEQFIASSLASIYNATTPLMTMLMAIAALPDERPTRRRLLGLGLGFGGVVVVLAPWDGRIGGSVAAQLGCLAATASYGAAFVYLRRYVAPRGLPALTVATMQVGVGGVIMMLLAPFIARDSVVLSASVVISMVLLGVVGTGLAYVWNTNVVSAWGATAGASVTYLTPIVGVVLGAALLGEHLHWNQPVGAIIVIFGIALSTRVRTRPPSDGDDPVDDGQRVDSSATPRLAD